MEIIKQLIDFILHIDRPGPYYQPVSLVNLSDIVPHYFCRNRLRSYPFLPGDSLLFAAGALIAAGGTGLDITLLALILIVAAFRPVIPLIICWVTTSGPKVFKENNKILKLDYYLQTKAFFDKHGGKAVIFSRFMPIIRTIAPFVAGVGRMPFLRYSIYNIIGGVSWIIIFLFAGYMLGNVPFFKAHFSLIGIGIILVSIIPPIYAAITSKRK